MLLFFCLTLQLSSSLILFQPLVSHFLDHPIVLGQYGVSSILPYQEAFTVLLIGLGVAMIIGFMLPNRPDWESEVHQASLELGEIDDAAPEYVSE